MLFIRESREALLALYWPSAKLALVIALLLDSLQALISSCRLSLRSDSDASIICIELISLAAPLPEFMLSRVSMRA